MIVFLLLATAFSSGAMPLSAGPLTNPTVIHTVVFGVQARSSCSDIRSMYQILRSCMFTIAACVYRAVHPNIPNPKFGFWQRLAVTIQITFWALMAPELIICWALRQWFGAKDVAQRVNTAIEGMKPDPGFKWTLTHGQFLQMGGFVRKDDKKVLTMYDLTRLLNEGFIDIEDLRLTEKEINDKSKGDLLSKVLVVSQTTWFVFECMARLHQGLPLLEIEVVTLAFATLNVITYGLWWYKPLNILCPIPIPIRSEPLKPAPLPSATTNTQEPSSEEKNAAPTPKQEGIVTVVLAMMKAMAAAVWGVMKTVAKALKHAVLDDKCCTLLVWLLWSFSLPCIVVFRITSVLSSELFDLMGGRGHFSGEDSDDPYLPQAFSAFIGMIFGAIHFISWDATFPTHTQLILWRASSIILVVQPFLVMLYAITGLALFACFGLVLGPVAYVFARFCVLVLAFLTLRHLPPDVFTNVSWTSYIPHF